MADADSALTSRPVVRTVAILDFLAQHPEQAFTLTELTRSLRLSAATAHAVLAALCDAGYVYRTAAKGYVLGPSLSRLGQAALAPSQVMNVARPEMRNLADEFDVVCSATYLDGHEAVIFERASAVSHIGWHPPHKLRVPMVAPLGGMFVAWDNIATREWLAGADPPLQPAEQSRLEQSLEFLRGRGFAFAERKVPIEAPERARALQNRQDLTDYGLSVLDPEHGYALAYIAAPVFSRPGDIGFVLSLAGFVGSTKGAAIEHMAERLRGACDRVGAFLAGRKFERSA